MRRIPGSTLRLGHAGDRRDVRAIFDAGIVAVVDLALEEPHVALPREIVCCRFPLLDGIGNPPWLLEVAVETVAAFLRADLPTLVSCGAGMSRSPAVVAAAVARVRGCPLPHALADVIQDGPADIAPGLWNDLEGALRTAGSTDL